MSEGLFDQIVELPFSRSANLHLPPSWGKLKKKFLKVVSEVKPDVIHAHNIVAAKLTYECRFSFIYDDHEYWSKSATLMGQGGPAKKLGRRFSRAYASRSWRKWETEIVASVPVITVSETIAAEHRKLGKKVAVVPNMPSSLELPENPLSEKRSDVLSSVYIGRETSAPNPHPVRDISGLANLFTRDNIGKLVVLGDEKLATKPPVYSTGFLDHIAMMKELTHHYVGLIPWKPFWFHHYCNPNKAYEYVHAGMRVLATYDLTPVLETLSSNCVPIKNYDDLAAKLAELKNKLDDLEATRGEIIRFAREHCMWERFEGKIFDAYSLA